MNDGPYIAQAAALIGDPARANMLVALIDGRALTAGELAHIAGISPQTASGHLARLRESGLVDLAVQGRHRYYRLASTDVARALEALMVVAERGTKRHRPTGPRAPAMRWARTCYDHLAGEVAVALTDRLIEDGAIENAGGDAFRVTPDGAEFLADFGVDLAAAKTRRRAFAKPCLDWSERRFHIAGALGAALLDRFEELDWIDRDRDGRQVRFTDPGRRGLKTRFGVAATPPG